MNLFDDFYRLRPGQWGYNDTCEAIGEHQGDPRNGVWGCCGEQDDE